MAHSKLADHSGPGPVDGEVDCGSDDSWWRGIGQVAHCLGEGGTGQVAYGPAPPPPPPPPSL